MAKELQKAAEAGVPAFLADAAQYADMGNSKAAQDNTLPYIAIIQKGSPQINDKKPEYIPGAKTGMLMNTATQKVFETLDVIVFGFDKKLVEWVPRTAGGGFRGQYNMDDPIGETAKDKIVDGKRRGLQLPNGNDLVETAYTFITTVERLGIPMVIGASSSALKPMRQWMTLRNDHLIPNGGGKSYPSFARVYRLSTVYQENDSGDWYNWKVEDLGWATQEQFACGLELAKKIDEMKVAPMEEPAGEGGGDDSAPI